MTRAWLVPLLLLAVPSAAAETFTLGPVAEVIVDANEFSRCSLGASGELCLADWSDQGTPDPGDDGLYLYHSVNRLGVRVWSPVGQPGGNLSFDTRTLLLTHPGFVLLNHTWVGLNDTLPAPVKTWLTLESRPFRTAPDEWGLFPVVHLPFTVKYPLGDLEADYLTPAFIAWDTPFSDYEHVYPFGKEMWWDETDTDENAHRIPWLLGECFTQVYLPPACTAWEAYLHEPAEDLASLYASVTPRVRLGLWLNETGVTVAPAFEDEGAGQASYAFERFVSSEDAPASLPASEEALSPLRHDVLVAQDWRMGNAPVVAGAQERPDYLSKALLADPTPTLLAAAAAGAIVVLGAWLYHRLRRERVLELETRRRVFEVIQREPGVRAGSVASALGLSFKTVTWHAQALQRAGLVTMSEGAPCRLFAQHPQLGAQERRALLASSTPVARVLLEELRRAGSLELKELCAARALPRSSASTAVSRLARAGVVVKHRSGRRVMVTMAGPPHSWNGPAPGDVGTQGA